MTSAGISLGSNLGDREGHLKIARDRLREIHEGTDDRFRVASLYETAPVDCSPGSPPFLNTAIELETTLGPLELLEVGQRIEESLGRPRTREPNAPRPIDIDLIYLGDTVLASPRLDLPHPRFRQRRFVLRPFAEICPGRRLPGETGTLAELLAGLESDEAEPVPLRSDW